MLQDLLQSHSSIDSGEGLAARVSVPGPVLPGPAPIAVTAVTTVNNTIQVPADIHQRLGANGANGFFYMWATTVNNHNPVPEVFNNHNLLHRVTDFLPDPDPSPQISWFNAPPGLSNPKALLSATAPLCTGKDTSIYPSTHPHYHDYGALTPYPQTGISPGATKRIAKTRSFKTKNLYLNSPRTKQHKGE